MLLMFFVVMVIMFLILLNVFWNKAVWTFTQSFINHKVMLVTDFFMVKTKVDNECCENNCNQVDNSSTLSRVFLIQNLYTLQLILQVLDFLLLVFNGQHVLLALIMHRDL
jgi:hypothetical protein